MKKATVIFLILCSMPGCVLLMKGHSFANSLMYLASDLPRQVEGWSAEEEDQVYDGETIFDYIDGAGEVYRSYHMQACLSRSYTTRGGPTIVLDIFDMGSSDDAFGVFTHDREGKPVEIGQGGLSRPGWLSFWKGRFFVSIYGEDDTGPAARAILRLAELTASRIGETGPEPAILLALPPKGLRPESVRYFHDHMLLNYHYYLSDENILNLTPHTNTLLASYERDGSRALLLLVSYPEEKEAEKAFERVLTHYLPDADHGGIARLENGKWSGTAMKKRLLSVVLDASSRQLAEALLGEAEARNKHGK